MEQKTYTIDAKNKVLGRLAVRVALLLRGKNKVDFEPRTDSGGIVNIKNVAEIKITGRKLEQKIYYRHTGYLGHLRETPLYRLFEKNPEEVLRKTVWGMLPRNKLRAIQIRRLKFIK